MTKLRDLGLTEYEEKVYLTLLKEGSLTGGKVSKLSKVPHGRTYEVLISLADKGFVSIMPIKPKVFKALDPKIAVKHLLNEKIIELDELAKSVPVELERLKKVKARKPTVGEKITIVSGKENMLRVIAHNIETAEKYIKSMFTYELESFSIIRAEDEALKRGVKIKHVATKLTPEGLKRMKRDIKKGIDVRYYPIEELRVSIRDGIDSSQGIINPKNPKERMTIFIESKELTKALEHYFDSIWRKAKKIEGIKL